MSRVRFRIANRLSAHDLRRLADGYVSNARYAVHARERPDGITFALKRTRLVTPYRKRFPLPAEELRRYRKLVRLGWSFGAYDGVELVGLALAEPLSWNRSVWVWELGVAPSHRRRGIATGLVRALARRAEARGYRVIVCETQTSNDPAIAFYRKAGFRFEGLDLSYYTNDDVRKGEVAIFLKKRLRPRKRSTRVRRRVTQRTSK